MKAERKLVNSRKDVKNSYMSDIVDDYIQKTPFYKQEVRQLLANKNTKIKKKVDKLVRYYSEGDWLSNIEKNADIVDVFT